MTLLAEYAITPDVFDAAAYSSGEVCGLHLQTIKEVMLQEGLVRNLRDGEWSEVFASNARPWHVRGKELLKKLKTQKRLVLSRAELTRAPSTDADWCDEALASHSSENLTGIIVTGCVAARYASHSAVASVEKLAGAPWWSQRSCSVRLKRTLVDYLAALRLVLRHANSIMFIDPHLDPCEARYSDFISLVKAAGCRIPAPRIEIHRVGYRGSGLSRQVLRDSDLVDLQTEFCRALSFPLADAGVSAKVFIWSDFHDRYVISDQIGISLPNGFDTTTSGVVTTWTRLSRADRDDIQREFDPAANRHKLRWPSFSIP